MRQAIFAVRVPQNRARNIVIIVIHPFKATVSYVNQ
jgi:hypothetical protein